MPLEIAVDDPHAPDVGALIERHLAWSRQVTPPGHVHALAVDALAGPGITFFGARRSGDLVGVGALKELDRAHHEIKSMHVSETARGEGVGAAIVAHLLAVAVERGSRRVSLETGATEAFAAARRLYERAGFSPCPPFAEYAEDPHSTCMTIEFTAR